MATDPPEPETAGDLPGGLPEKIGPADLEALNRALAALFGELRFARKRPPGKTDGRLAAVVALSAAWRFLVSFELVLQEGLHVPLLNLNSALLALNENNVEPILKPTKRIGRAISSPRYYALIGNAVGAAQQLELTRLRPAQANKAIANKLSALDIKPTRGKNDVTAGTVRRWRERIDEVRPFLKLPSQKLVQQLSAEQSGWVNAALIAEDMLSDKSRTKIQALAPATARRFVLAVLDASVTAIGPWNPPNPPT
jgi:hypothetical protein